MRDLKAFVQQRVAALALSPEHERKIVEEWGTQLEDAYEALRAGGLSDEEAWRELQAQVPDWNALRDELLVAEPVVVRLANSPRMPFDGEIRRSILRRTREALTTGLSRDVRDAFRTLVRERSFSAAVVLTLMICLGANAAIFTVVHAVLLRPVDVPEPDRLVMFGDVYPTITPNDILANDAPSYFDRRRAYTTLEEMAMFTFWYDTIAIEGVPQEVRGMRVTPSLFRLLGVAPALGRTFTDGEDEIGADRRVILSHGLWQRLYGGDTSVVGKTLRLGWTGQSYTIIGVMPPGFQFFDLPDGHARTPDGGAQFWIPLALTPAQKSDEARTRYGFFQIGRLRPEATLEQLSTQVDALHRTYIDRFPQFGYDDLGMYTVATPLEEALTRDVRRTLYLLWGGAAFVLLIGALNIANLALARASTRSRELATRLALGAGRGAIARQLVIEACVPAAIGAAGGIVIAALLLDALGAQGLAQLPRADRVGMNAAVIGYIAAVAACVGLLIGLVPASSAGTAIQGGLLDGSRTATGGRNSRLFRRTIVVTQVALSVVLLIAATLLFTSFRNLLGIDAGFTAARVTTATIFPPPSRYPDAASVAALSNRLLERIRTIPGIEVAGMTTNIALSGNESPSTVSTVETPPPGEPAIIPSVVGITPGYFEAMATPLVRGRYFTDADRAGTQRVAIVDERLAARLWPGGDPLGGRIYRGDTGPFTVVGVVRTVRYEGLASVKDPIGTAYFPHTQAPPLGRLRWIVVKAAADPSAVMGAIRSAALEIDRDLPLSDVQTMSERKAGSLVRQNLAMNVAALFAGVALLLSMLGIYGVLANVVAARTREFGIRMALGSSVGGVFRLVIGEGLMLIGIGVGLGVAGALVIARALQSQLFGVQPTDPVIFGAVAAVTGAIALAACVAPARRATRVDPVAVLSAQ
ncbi:MAG TPA: ABC transporter permease [Vicinamibacterales bacterium]